MSTRPAYPFFLILSMATKMISAPLVRGIHQAGRQVSSTILMYIATRGRGTILVAIESSNAPHRRPSTVIDSSFMVLDVGVRPERPYWSIYTRRLYNTSKAISSFMSSTSTSARNRHTVVILSPTSGCVGADCWKPSSCERRPGHQLGVVVGFWHSAYDSALDQSQNAVPPWTWFSPISRAGELYFLESGCWLLTPAQQNQKVGVAIKVSVDVKLTKPCTMSLQGFIGEDFPTFKAPRL